MLKQVKEAEAQMMLSRWVYILCMCYVLMRASVGNSELHESSVVNIPRSESRSAL